MNFKQLDVIKVPVKNQEKSRDFYVEKFGFEVRLDESLGEGKRWIELIPFKGARTSIAPVSWGTEVVPGSALGLVLTTDNIVDDRNELLGKGVEVSDIEELPWGSFIYFKDLDGNPWTAVQPK